MVYTVVVEIILNSYSHVSKSAITSVVHQYLKNRNIVSNMVISHFNKDEHPILYADVKAIVVEGNKNFDEAYVDFSENKINWYVYTLDTCGPIQQRESVGDDEELNLATHLTLPSSELYNIWENLYYDNNVKDNLLKYAQTIMEFSDKGVDCNVVSCNRVILLHGPPGTGKTSLCKALAQKLTIRMQDRYTSGLFIEINSHSLFSKWFSESGKLVTKMFTKVKEIVENTSVLVCVLIDEVESLAHARNQCVSGNEPSDSIRVVNAVLTQIDQIRRHSNVLILTTSNMTEAIDLAFVDRADIKQFLDLPSVPAIYKIYHSCLEELMKAQVINYNCDMIDVVDLVLNSENTVKVNESSRMLLKVCEKSIGLSGRSLRKIPFLAHALFLNQSFADVVAFIMAMEKAVQHEHNERKYFKHLK